MSTAPSVAGTVTPTKASGAASPDPVDRARQRKRLESENEDLVRAAGWEPLAAQETVLEPYHRLKHSEDIAKTASIQQDM